MKRIISAVLAFAMLISLAGCASPESTVQNIKDKAGNVTENIAEAAKDGYHSVSEFADNQAEKAKDAVAALSLPDFQQGFEKVASFFGSTVATLGGQAYVNSVAQAISDLERNIAERVNTGPIASNAGNLAEEWHAGTFNIDSIAKDIKNRASTEKSNKLGSPDVSLSDGTKASLKYYNTAELSAQQQAKNYIERYNEYVRGSENALSMDEWLSSNGINLAVDDPELYWSIYKDQVRIIPKDQINAALECLEKSVKSNAAKDGANRQYVADSDLETLKNLTDRIKSSDGAESVPLTKADAEAIAKAAQEGDFTAADFGITTGGAITGACIAKQAMKSGATAGIIEAAVVLGPEIYEIIKYGIENGEIDEEQLKTAGLDGLSAAGDGFLKGSISNALVVMCQAGKLGTEYASPSPELIGAVTVLVVDAIRYGIKTANGKMSLSEYIDVLAEEVIVSAGSLGSAALVGLIFPQATLAIMIGSFIGGLVVSAGYKVGKTYVLALVDFSDEIDLLVPIEAAADTVKNAAEMISIKVSDAVSELKNIGTKAAEDISISVYNLKGIFN